MFPHPQALAKRVEHGELPVAKLEEVEVLEAMASKCFTSCRIIPAKRTPNFSHLDDPARNYDYSLNDDDADDDVRLIKMAMTLMTVKITSKQEDSNISLLFTLWTLFYFGQKN